MTFRSRILFILFAIVSLVGLIYQWATHDSNSNRYYPTKKEVINTETIDFRHVQRNCVCSDWVKVAGKNDQETVTQEFIFIQPLSADMGVPASYFALADSGYVLRLHGNFSNEKDLPVNYQNITDPKPEKARIFYYNSFEVVKPE